MQIEEEDVEEGENGDEIDYSDDNKDDIIEDDDDNDDDDDDDDDGIRERAISPSRSNKVSMDKMDMESRIEYINKMARGELDGNTILKLFILF